MNSPPPPLLLIPVFPPIYWLIKWSPAPALHSFKPWSFYTFCFPWTVLTMFALLLGFCGNHRFLCRFHPFLRPAFNIQNCIIYLFRIVLFYHFIVILPTGFNVGKLYTSCVRVKIRFLRVLSFWTVINPSGSWNLARVRGRRRSRFRGFSSLYCSNCSRFYFNLGSRARP